MDDPSRSEQKPLFWVATSLDELKEFPEEVRRVMGFALHLAQLGDKHPDAKPLKGFGSAGVLEIVDDFSGDTYRGVYTVRFKGRVYVLHAFQKKAKKGAETPKATIRLVEQRLKAAKAHYEAELARSKEKKH